MPTPEAYKEALRSFLEQVAIPVVIDSSYTPDCIWGSYSVYGWKNRTADAHVKECGLIIPEGAAIKEVVYSQFTNTINDDKELVGMSAWGGDKHEPTTIHCACGQYTGLMVRWEGSFYAAVQGALGANSNDPIVL